MKYDWLYLCSDPEKLELTLRYLPTPFEGLQMLYVGWCSHLDSPERFTALKQTAAIWTPPGWRVGFIDLSGLLEHLPSPLIKYWANEKTRWSLGMKLLLPLAFNSPFLYTDDDVIVTRDPVRLLLNGGWGSKGSFRFPSQKRGIAMQLFDAFSADSEGDECYRIYNEHALDAGVFFSGFNWNHVDCDLWKYRLRQFAGLPYIAGLTTNNLELRCLDQRFLTMWGFVSNWRQQTISNGFAPPSSISDGLINRHEFIHYKTSSKLSKQRWKDAFRARLR